MLAMTILYVEILALRLSQYAFTLIHYSPDGTNI